jgi:glycolate oxidase
MRRELGPIAVGMQRAIKLALDPRGILNPGKAIG